MSTKIVSTNIYDENSIDDRDREEYDDFCQKVVEISKLIAIFQDDDRYYKYYEKNQEIFEQMRANIESINVILPTVFNLMPIFDFGNVRANGYRSFFKIIYRCLHQLEIHLHSYKSSFRFTRHTNQLSMNEYADCFNQLTIVAKYLIQMMLANSKSSDLFMSRDVDEGLYCKVMDCFEKMKCEVFYGQCLGFYLSSSCQGLAKVLCSIQLGLGQAMTLQRSNVELIVTTMVNSAQSFILENRRSESMTHLYKQASVKFCKQFWNLVDHPILAQGAQYVLPSLKVVKEVTLEPVGLEFQQTSKDGTLIRVNPPTAHTGHAEVHVRILSNKLRPGMEWISSHIDKDTEPSKFLLFHCHGGGFVAQSSQSHDSYLRNWAISLNCPIVSVDYSHAPEYPFPRAHEECLYAYCWCAKSLAELGCDPRPGETQIIICGDSAGGNLALGVLLQVNRLMIPSVPAAAFLAYPATLVDFVPSPARILGILDPILPLGVLARCLLAYGGINEEYLVRSMSAVSLKNQIPRNESNSKTKMNDLVKDFTSNPDINQNIDNNKSPDDNTPTTNSPPKFSLSTDSTDNEIKKKTTKSINFLDVDTLDSHGETLFYSKESSVSPIILLENANLPRDPIMSPLIADDEDLAKFPPMTICASQFDPLLDDSVEFCKRVSKAAPNQLINLHVMSDLPHGFLNMASPITHDCTKATQFCLDSIHKLMDYVSPNKETDESKL